MPSGVRIIRADAPERARLERDGWAVVAHSWGAQLDAQACDVDALRRLAARAEPLGGVRRLTAADVPGILALDASTLRDYPGAEATAHPPLTAARAALSESRVAYGVADPGGVTTIRTGGSADNPAIVAANRAVGFVVDEHWVTLRPVGGGTSGQA